MVKTLPLLESSPRTLVSSLDQYYRRSRSPSDEMVIRSNDLAVMEILRERRAAIESGKLKGRRLFEELEGWNWNNNGLHEDCEVRSVSVTTSYYDSDDDGSEGKLPAAAAGTYSSSSCASLGVHVAAQMKQAEKKVVVRVLLAVALVICALGITSVWIRYRDDYEVTLVPT